MIDNFTAIITVAGISSRFNAGVSEEESVLKAIYTEGSWQDTLLANMVAKCSGAQRIIIVGGYRYDDLERYIKDYFPTETQEKIELVYNEHYWDLASGYSLYLGIKRAAEGSCSDTIVFAEGDLDTDTSSFEKVLRSPKSVITYNNEPIFSNKAVICYCNAEGKYKYAFSTSHGLVRIEESFSRIMNSGQIWKFSKPGILEESASRFVNDAPEDTNLRIIQDYFDNLTENDVEIVSLDRWTNCNTRDDYRNIVKMWEDEKK